MKRILFTLFLSCQLVLAGTTGKIAGRVIDASTREPLPSVNLQLAGTSYGAVSDPDGNYFILNLPVGTYTLRASMVGYGSKSVSNIVVQVDMTTTLDLTIEPSSVQMNDVIIIAERPAIQMDRTSTKHTVDADVINSLPVDDFREVVQLQAGVVGSHFRGGRFNEALFLVDGMQVKSAVNGYTGYTAGFAINLPQISVSEIQVSTGGFEAEYGNAQSGVVNTLTRDAGGKFGGKVRFRTSDFPWAKMEYVPNNYGKGLPDWKNTEVTLNTPSFDLGFGKLFLLGSADVSWQTKDFLPHEDFSRQSYQAKANFSYGDSRIVISGLRSFSQSNSYYHSWSKYGPLSDGYQSDFYQRIVTESGKKILNQYHYVLDPQNYPNPDTMSISNYIQIGTDSANIVRNYYVAGMQSHISVPSNESYNAGFTWTQAITNRSYIDLKVSYFNTHFREIVHDVDDRNKDGNTTQELNWKDNGQQFLGYKDRPSPEDGYWQIYGDEGWWFDQVARSTSFRLDYSNQLNQSNLLKTGAEFNYHQGEVNKVTSESTSNPRFDIWSEDLYDAAFYIQDKIEVRNGFILNAGIRFDYYDPNGFGDVVLYPADLTTLPDHKDAAGLTNADKVESRWQISPRIGISHPITERDKIHFYYGHFFQRPDFRYLYENIVLNFRYTTNVDLGNPRLLPEKTVSYEVGWEHLFSDFLRLGVTGYFKDITNLIGANDFVIPGSPSTYQAYSNMDYANVRGIELSLETIGIRSFGGSINYTYAFANGRSSSVFRSNGEIVPRRLDPLSWDVRHKINANIQVRTVGWLDQYVGDAELDFVIVAQSGMPYTTNTRDVFPLFALRNDGRLPWTSNVDLRARKSFRLAKLDVSILAEVRNLFDTRNVEFIAGGRDGLSEFEATGNPTGPYQDPTAYSQPRVYRLGFEIQL